MKILIIGAPGSGKSKLARSLARKHKLKNFDNLPEKFIKKTDLALGEVSDYRSDIIFTSSILEMEYKHRDNDYVITAGPFHTYCHFLTKVSFLDKDDPKILEFLWIILTVGRMTLDSLWYDEIYYIPYKKEEDSFSFYFDESIKKTIKEFNIGEKVITLE
jgi:GTPase SAR1 family protein